MTHTRGKKFSKAQQTLQKTLVLINSIKKLEDAGALKIDRIKRDVSLIREIFWDSKDDNWRHNFVTNLHIIMDLKQKELLMDPIHIYAIDMESRKKGRYITSYLPDLKTCKEILNP